MGENDAFALCKAVGNKSRIHFNRYCLAPKLEKGLVVRTDPEHPNLPHQEYERSGGAFNERSGI